MSAYFAFAQHGTNFQRDAYTVVQVLGYRWQAALAAVFVGGVLFLLLTVFQLRQWLVGALPESLRYSFAVGIGLFLAFVGFNECGIVAIGVPGAPVKAGNLISGPVLLANWRLSADRDSIDPPHAGRNSDRNRRHHDLGDGNGRNAAAARMDQRPAPEKWAPSCET